MSNTSHEYKTYLKICKSLGEQPLAYEAWLRNKQEQKYEEDRHD